MHHTVQTQQADSGRQRIAVSGRDRHIEAAEEAKEKMVPERGIYWDKDLGSPASSSLPKDEPSGL